MRFTVKKSVFPSLCEKEYFYFDKNSGFLKDGQILTTVNMDENVINTIKGLFVHNRTKFLCYIRRIDKKTEELVFNVFRYVPLHVHTGYSLLDGASRIKDLVSKTDDACAITDHGNLHAMLKFYKSMKKAGKTPIIGFEAYTESKHGGKDRNHMVLLAKNQVGLKNLIKLTSNAYMNFNYKPHVSYAELRKYSEGIIATSACISGEIPRLIKRGYMTEARQIASEFKSIFKDDFYLEVQRHSIEVEHVINRELIKIGKELDIKVIATGDSHYTEEEDKDVHQVMLCLQTGTTISDPKKLAFTGEGFHFQTPEEMDERFKDMPEVLENTLEILAKVDSEMVFEELRMPDFIFPKEFNSEAEYLEHLCWKGFEERFRDKPNEMYNGVPKFESQEYKDRLRYEIDTIVKMKFPGYFLIVWDFVRYAKDNRIAVGPGRGSVVGSLLAYCLKISNLDPIPYGLIFERFLNPERVTIPDIDLDFADDRRAEVIKYVRDKYGDESVSKIVTFGTMSAKSVVRDVARVLDKPYAVGNNIAKAIPVELKMTISKALKVSPDLIEMYNNDPDVKEVITIALRLEGLPRHKSQHACGLIISPSSVSDFLPECMIEDKDTGIRERTSQVDKDETEEMGLPKMDFLGLRTMSVISNAIDEINPKRIALGLEPLNYETMTSDNVDVYKFISKGDLHGVFQLESGGMTSFMKDLFHDVPHKILAVESEDILSEAERKEKLQKLGIEFFERLIAGISLYRPGPMDEIPNYIANMRNPESIIYDAPALESILAPTYGVIVYQEQVMQIVRDLAGYSLGRSDLIRRGMAKKKEEIIIEERKNFIYGNEKEKVIGCTGNNIPEKVGIKTWARMEDFAKYAFNKSHAGGYAVIAYQTAYLKNFYPIEFMTATLNSVLGKAKILNKYLSVAINMGIDILPPSLNDSMYDFKSEKNGIRFGLKGLKSVGDISGMIIEERNSERGVFESYQDFTERMTIHYRITKSVLRALIYSGALDGFEGTRHSKIEALDIITDYAKKEKKQVESGQLDLFSMNADFKSFKIVDLPILDEYCKAVILEKEKEYSGLYISGHPLDDYKFILDTEKVVDIALYNGSSNEDEDFELDDVNNIDGASVKFAGILKEVKTVYTNNGNKPMKVFVLEDKSGEINSIAFNKVTVKYGHIIQEGAMVKIDGIISVSEDFGEQLIVNGISDIKDLKEKKKPSKVYVKVFNSAQQVKLDELISKNIGNVPVVMKKTDNVCYQLKTGLSLDYTTFNSLRNIFGTEYVHLVYA